MRRVPIYVLGQSAGGREMEEEARVGRRWEDALANLINSDKRFAASFSACVRERLGLAISGDIRAQRDQGVKADIHIFDSSGRAVGLSLKARGQTGRPDDHLDRRWLDDWREALNMPSPVYEAFWRGIMRKAVDGRASLVLEKDRPLVRDFLLSNLDAFLEEAFRRGERELQLFAVIEHEGEATLYVFRMDDVIGFVREDVRETGIEFAKVIRLGRFLWVQRKAGDSREIDKRLPKTDPRHPGNQLQVKILPIPLKNEAVKRLKHCEFKLPLNHARMGGRRLNEFL
jgi:hypothetical protein